MSVARPGNAVESEGTVPQESFTFEPLSGEDSDMNVQDTGVASCHLADAESSPQEDHYSSL